MVARMNTLTMSLDPCPRCGRAHHLPLIFVPLETPVVKKEITYTYLAQCTWTLNPVLARLNETDRLEVEK